MNASQLSWLLTFSSDKDSKKDIRTESIHSIAKNMKSSDIRKAINSLTDTNRRLSTDIKDCEFYIKSYKDNITKHNERIKENVELLEYLKSL